MEQKKQQRWGQLADFSEALSPVVNKYISSPRKMTREAATAKARKLKAEALGL